MTHSTNGQSATLRLNTLFNMCCFFTVILNVAMLSVPFVIVMLSAIMLVVVMLNVVAPLVKMGTRIIARVHVTWKF
jgi:hypothetical protein